MALVGNGLAANLKGHETTSLGSPQDFPNGPLPTADIGCETWLKISGDWPNTAKCGSGSNPHGDLLTAPTG